MEKHQSINESDSLGGNFFYDPFLETKLKTRNSEYKITFKSRHEYRKDANLIQYILTASLREIYEYGELLDVSTKSGTTLDTYVECDGQIALLSPLSGKLLNRLRAELIGDASMKIKEHESKRTYLP
ncbi:MAG: hypothetical protein FWC00_03750 [Firmicutes bacterium]|nr:hypothetical protein [Bacillota bacterium]